MKKCHIPETPSKHRGYLYIRHWTQITFTWTSLHLRGKLHQTMSILLCFPQPKTQSSRLCCHALGIRRVHAAAPRKIILAIEKTRPMVLLLEPAQKVKIMTVDFVVRMNRGFPRPVANMEHWQTCPFSRFRIIAPNHGQAPAGKGSRYNTSGIIDRRHFGKDNLKSGLHYHSY